MFAVTKKQVIYTVVVIIFLLIGNTLFKPTTNQPAIGRVIFPEQGLIVQVDIAETEKQRAQGLMLRPLLAVNTGMLFIFEREERQRVWMKKTLIELDVIFFSEKKVVVSTFQALKPCVQLLCKVYHSNKKAKYMLEVNAGVIEKSNIRVGQKIIFDRL